jgi:cytochrome c biogenesis protein CcdA
MHDVLGLLLLGIVNGATICSFSCMMYIGPYLLSNGSGFKDGVQVTLRYLFGKIASYSLMGGFAALTGQLVVEYLSYGGKIVMGGSLIGIGLLLPLLKQGRCLARHRNRSFMGLGFVTSLIPCPALSGMILSAANQASVLTGAFYGLVYSLGLLISPVVIAGGGISFLSSGLASQIKEFMPYLRGLAMIMLVIMGINIIVSS